MFVNVKELRVKMLQSIIFTHAIYEKHKDNIIKFFHRYLPILISWTTTLVDVFWRVIKPVFALRIMSALVSLRLNMTVKAMVTKESPQVS